MRETTAVEERLKELRKRFAAALGARVAVIHSGLAEAFAGRAGRDAWVTAHRGLHSLAGSSGTLGFAAVSRTARAAETLLQDCLEGQAPPSAEGRARLGGLVDELAALAAVAEEVSRDSANEGRRS